MFGYQNHPAMPYGAFELKATYQRNLIFGNLSVLLLVALALATAYAYSALFGETTVVIPVDPMPEPIEIAAWILPPPLVEQPEPPINPSPSNPNQEMTNNLSLVADSLWDDSRPEERLPTQGELSINAGEGDTTGIGSIDTSGLGQSEYFPGENEFIHTEKLPDFVSYVKPDYPSIARQAGLEGTVIVKVLVDKNGAVRDAKVARSSGYAALDNAAIGAAFKNTYTPGIQNGYPVACWVTYRVEFKLNE
ncbi:MAG: energy transducer TonB [candidate division Zixibacteria bacterium]|nr:energy transducer TonB [candidate division Zixibacteria bacterium]